MTNRQFFTILGRPHNAIAALAGLVCLLTAGLGETARSALRYERAAVAAGQLWRALTAHFVHLNLTHTLLNVAGLALVAAVFYRELRVGDWLGGGFAAALCIAAGLYWFEPETAWYVGLSGLLHGWFLLGAARISEQQRGFGLTLLGALAGKLAFEQTLGTMPFTLALDVGPVVVAAHLYGAAGAALFYVTLRVLAGRRKRSL